MSPAPENFETEVSGSGRFLFQHPTDQWQQQTDHRGNHRVACRTAERTAQVGTDELTTTDAADGAEGPN
jgi:hypothetical protein